MANVPSLIFTFSLFLTLAHVGATPYPSNDHRIQLANQIVDAHFPECGVIKIMKRSTEEFNKELSTPVTLINFQEPNYKIPFQNYNRTSNHDIVTKRNQQCWVYLFSIIGFDESDFLNLYKALKIRTLQVQATFSYLITSEYDNFPQAQNFVLSENLHNYQHRILIKADTQSAIIERFCFFCHDGGAGFLPRLTYYNFKYSSEFSTLFPDITRDFNGKVMRVTGPLAPPLVLILPSKSRPGTNEIQGQHANIVKSFAKHFNFTFRPHSSPATGIKLPNGTWTGIMGEILYDTADIGVSVATSHERYQIVDATVSVFYAFLVLVSTKPKPIFEWQAIFYPFKMSCWMAFIVSTVFTFFASKWLHNNAIKYEIPAALKGNPQEVIKKLKMEFMTNYKSFYITVGQLLEQGTPFDFNTTPSRMYILFWMFFAMIITTAYRSKLFTFLTFPTVEVPPSSFLELSRSTYKWGMKHLGGIAFVFITKSPLPYIRQVGERMAVYNDKFSCLDRTFTDRFTCIIYKAYIDYVAEVRYWKVRHQLHISDFVTPPVGSAWVLPKYAPWLPGFDKISSAVYEMSLAQKYLEDYQVQIAKVLRDKAQASNETKDKFPINDDFKGEDDGPKPLVMANLYAAFCILILGLLLGGLILLCEVVRRKNFNEKLRKRQQRLNIHLRRKIRQKKWQLPQGSSSRLSFQQVVRVIMPNSNDIIELSREYPMK